METNVILSIGSMRKFATNTCLKIRFALPKGPSDVASFYRSRRLIHRYTVTRTVFDGAVVHRSNSHRRYSPLWVVRLSTKNTDSPPGHRYGEKPPFPTKISGCSPITPNFTLTLLRTSVVSFLLNLSRWSHLERRCDQQRGRDDHAPEWFMMQCDRAHRRGAKKADATKSGSWRTWQTEPDDAHRKSHDCPVSRRVSALPA